MGENCLGTVGNHCEGKMPVIRDRGQSDNCARARGGTKTVGIPRYVLTVVNEQEDLPGSETVEIQD